MSWLAPIANTVTPQNPNFSPLPHVSANDSTIQIILTIVFTTTGAISLLIMTIAGFRYITSRGTPQEVGKSKNAIVYSLIGLIISITAGTIVAFVIGNLT